MAIKLAQEVNGQTVGETYSGPAALLPWLTLEGYVYDDAASVSHISTTGALPEDDPTLAVNREDPSPRETVDYVDDVGDADDGPEVEYVGGLAP